MDNFPKTLAEAKLYLARIKPWALIATIVALIVVGFYSVEGWRYWQSWEQSRIMTSQIQRINAKLDQDPPFLEESAGSLALREKRLEYFANMFDQGDVSQLIGIVSATSWESKIELPSISASDAVFEEVGDTRYRTQTLSLTAQGDVEDIYRFLSNLQVELPVFSVANISFSEPGPATTSKIQLKFYLLPEIISDEEASD